MSDNIKTAFWILVTATVACFIIMVSIGVARAQVGFWDRPAIRACCSEADALYADDWRVMADGSIIAKVTGGGPRGHAWAPVGREYKIPRDKVRDREGNPTGRPLLFLNKHNQEWVFCFVPGVMT